MQHQLSVHWCVDNPITFTLESWAEIDIVINRFTDNGVSSLRLPTLFPLFVSSIRAIYRNGAYSSESRVQGLLTSSLYLFKHLPSAALFSANEDRLCKLRLSAI